MDWTNAARTLLNTSPTPSCPALTDALAAVERGDLEAATGHLTSLNEEQRLLATFLVEIAAARASADGAALAGLCGALHTLPENTVDLSDIPSSLLHAWAEVVAPRVPPAVVARRDSYGYGQTLLCRAIERLSSDGEAARAVAYAELLSDHHRSDVARAWSRVGLALPEDHPRRGGALMRAAEAGCARPMIQDGGEEASAHGVAIQAFATGGLAADDPAVTRSLKDLLKLGRHRARKDVRSHGVATSSIAAGRRALHDADAGWQAIAEQLAALVWDEGPMRSESLEMARRARQAIDPGDTTARGDVDAVTPAEGTSTASARPEELARRRAAGEDVDGEIEAALGVWDGYGLKSVARFVNGCRLGLDDDRLEELLAAVRAGERAEALVKAANYAMEAGDERRAAWLNRGYPEGDPYGIFSADLLHLLSPERQLAGELFYAASGQTRGLALLLGLHMKHGRTEDAARIIARMGQPAVDDAWVPSYRRGNRASSALPSELFTSRPSIDATPVTADTVKAALSQAKAGSELYALALGAEDAETLAKVVKASRLKKWAKKTTLPWVARIRLLTGELDEALDIFEDWTSGRFDEHLATALLHTLADHLRTTDTATAARIRRLVAIFAKIHPQWPVYAFTALARAAIHVEPAEREAMTALIRSTMSQRYRCTGDHVYGLMGLAHGRVDVGDIDAARALLSAAVTRASADSIYFKGPPLLVTLAQVSHALPADEFTAHCLAALRACIPHEQRHYAQLMMIELGLRSLWPQGADITIALFAPDVLPQVIARDLQRSVWADIEHVPEPLRVLEALWPAEAVLPEIAQECVGALARALTLAEHPDASDVRALLTAAADA